MRRIQLRQRGFRITEPTPAPEAAVKTPVVKTGPKKKAVKKESVTTKIKRAVKKVTG